jgi:hypothetical protein
VGLICQFLAKKNTIVGLAVIWYGNIAENLEKKKSVNF